MTKKKTKKEQLQDKIAFLENIGKINAKNLSKNRTTWETKLYNTLKDLHYKFEFQVPVIVNKLKAPQLFILDFYLKEFNLVIEVDSKQFHSNPKDIKSDNRRTKLLKKEGFDILRFWNSQITRYSKEEIQAIISQRILMLKKVNKPITN